MNLPVGAGPSDEELCRLSRAGDRDAFGRIVERYQSLVCSVAYSACGRLAESEDLAQDTFITAWQRLADLKEPDKLRQWLCGIARNLSLNASRKSLRRGGPSESIDLISEHPSPDGEPGDTTIRREEEHLLWHTLESMPENYREPLVLFYREHQSVAAVARQLDLTEDTVKQRLSRGRALLREEMAALVETTLVRTRPGRAFTVGVLVGLPMAGATTAGAAVMTGTTLGGGAGAAGKGLLAKLGLGALIGPVIGLFFAWVGTRAAASTARSAEERCVILRYSRVIIAFCFLMSIGLAAVLTQAGKLYTPSAGWIVTGVCAWTAALVGGIMLMCQRLDRAVERIRLETNTTDAPYGKALAGSGRTLKLPRYFESRTTLLGLPLFAMAWGGNSADRHPKRTVTAWLAIGDIAVSPFFAFGGLAVAPIAMGAISIGVLSISVFWGVAFGVLAMGSLAFGWWAVGCAAAAVKCAVGFAAVARDYAIGSIASSAHSGAAAKEWVKTQWFSDFHNLVTHQLHWWLLLSVAIALALAWWRRRAVGPNDAGHEDGGADA